MDEKDRRILQLQICCVSPLLRSCIYSEMLRNTVIAAIWNNYFVYLPNQLAPAVGFSSGRRQFFHLCICAYCINLVILIFYKKFGKFA